MGNGPRLPADVNERTALIRDRDNDYQEWPRLVLYKILLCAFLVSTSFGFTQVPMLYAFRLMTCEAYYDDHPHPPSNHTSDPCNVNAIEASTAQSVSLLGVSTTLFGLTNLFIAGWTIKKIGVKYALLIQVFWPAARLAIQNVGIMVGGVHGIIIVQCSQIITIIGGPNGYVLALNTYITEVVNHEQRTGALGQLAGFMMFGSATGFLIGGVIGETFSIIMPYRAAMLMFLLSTGYVAMCLPYIKSDNMQAKGKAKSFFAPLKLFAPQKWITTNGKTERQYGSLLLCVGVFLSILATGYLNTLLQMYATSKFGFGTQANGILIFVYSMLRGVFLTFVFPRIIKAGRAFVSRKANLTAEAEVVNEQPDATDPAQIEVTDPILNEREPLLQPISRTTTKDTHVSNHSLTEDNTVSPDVVHQETYDFDLFYCKFSILADSALTFLATFVRNGPEMYAISAILPLSAGTGSASKGTILQMCAEEDRTDALAGISLVENMARLSTTFVFGLIFAAFADIGRTELTFAVNAAVALLGFVVLLGCRFPPKGSERYVSPEE